MKLKHTAIVAVVLSVLSVGLRTYQILFAIEPVTGFFKSPATQYGLYGFLVASFVLLFLATRRRSEREKEIAKLPHTNILGFAGIAVGAALGYDGVMAILNLDLKANELLWNITAVFCILSGLSFLYIGVRMLSGDTMTRPIRVVWVIPMLWSLLRLIESFIRYTSIANISAQLFEVLLIVFSSLFLLASGGLVAGIHPARNRLKSVRYGLMLFLFGLTATVPQLIAEYGFSDRLAYTPLLPRVSDVLLCVYALLFALLVIAAPIVKHGGEETAAVPDVPESVSEESASI